MSKHEKTVRRTRRKTDDSRRKRARTRGLFSRHARANPLGGSHIRHGAAALAAAAALAGGTVAYAEVVRFDNPPHGDPGHFEWISLDPFPGVGLDPTLDAASQTGGNLGPGEFHQYIYPGSPYTTMGTGGTPSGEVLVGDTGGAFPDGSLLFSLNSGDSIPTGPEGVSWKDFGYVYYPAGPGSLLPEGLQTYVGIRFPIGGNTHYGWIGVVRQNTYELETFAWGYETEPGVPIAAGAGGGCGDDADCDDGVFCNGAEVCDPENEGAGDDGCVGGGAACAEDQICDEDAAQCISVGSLIIKQGACPAPVNVNGNGVVPMVLAGSGGFAASTAVPGSLELRRCDGAGGSATPIANQTKLKDLNHPNDGDVQCGECSCNDDQSSDGITDLSLKFATNDLVAAGLIGPGEGQVGLELTGELADGTPFVARDCVAVLPPGDTQQTNANVNSNEPGAFIGVLPVDLNADSDGFANFARAYEVGTEVTLTAPSVADGRRFLRWMVDGQLQSVGMRTVEVTIAEGTMLKALYKRSTRVRPDRPSEGSGDME